MAKPEFLDVEGVPVSLGTLPGAGGYCRAWDRLPPRPFDASSASRNGRLVSEDEFWGMVRAAVLASAKATP
jgi:hypothetical protein